MGWKWGWNADDMSSTGWPYRFIGYGGYFSHYELEWLAFAKSIVVWAFLSMVSALAARAVGERLRGSDRS